MQNIKQKTKYGMLWNAFENMSVQGISFIVHIILARLLSPSDYGIIGLLTIFFIFSNVFIDSGFSRALIQNQDRSEEDFSTVFIFNVIISIVIYFVLFIFSPVIANYFGFHELILLQKVLFINIILTALTVVQNVKLQINIDFRKIALIKLISISISSILAIISAIYGYGVWSLVILNVSKNIISTIFFWIYGKWIPSAKFSLNSLKKLLPFSFRLLLSDLLTTITNNILNLIIGKAYKPDQLGLYTRARQFPEIIFATLNSAFNTATFPLLASLQNDKTLLQNAFIRLIKTSAILIFPLMAGLAILSEEIIIFILTDKWLLSVPYLFWISLSFIFIPLSTLNLSLMNAIGRSDVVLKVELAKIPMLILTLIITLPISIKAVLIGQLAISFINYLLTTVLITKLIKLATIKQFLALRNPIIASLIMVLFICIIKELLTYVLFVKLAIIIICAVVVYYFSLKILKEEELSFLLKNIINLFK